MIGAIFFAGIEVAVVITDNRAPIRQESIVDYAELTAWIIVALALIISVCLMNRTIKKTEFALPNQRLVIAHQLNFVIWLVVFALRKVLFLRADGAYLEYYQLPVDDPDYLRAKQYWNMRES